MTDGLLGTLYDPAHNIRAGVLEQVIRVILDVAAAFDLCLKRDDNQSAPGTFIGGTDLWKMVCVQHNGM